jgi:hypothetical protein
LHVHDLSLLKQLQDFFDCGSISFYKTRNMVSFNIYVLQDLTTNIIFRFDKYLLLTQKAADFILFKKAVQLMNNLAHLTAEGLQ